MLKVLLAVAVLFAAQGARAENTIFGFTMGMTQRQVDNLLLPSESNFTCGSSELCTATYLPHGFDSAGAYAFSFGSSGEGLYQIVALFECKDDSYGYDVRRVYRKLKADLSGVYGEPYEVDHIAHDSLWKDRRYFIQSLRYGHRELVSQWDSLPKGPLADRNLKTVVLRASYPQQLKGVVIAIAFKFKNMDAVESAKRKARKF